MKIVTAVNSIYVLAIIGFLSGCTASTNSPTNIITPDQSVATPISSSNQPTSTATTTPTSSIIFTPTTESTKLPSASPNSSKTLVPIQTVGPTMTSNEMKDLISLQIASTDFCKLPCWWDSSPGQTHWQAVLSSYLAHGLDPKPFSNTYQVQWRIIEGSNTEINYGQTYTVGKGERSDTIETISIGANLVVNHRLTFNNPHYYKLFSHYMLSSFLSSLGLPQSVKVITTQVAGEDGQVPFYLFVDYPTKGVSVYYSGFASIIGDQYELCPHQSFFHLFLWSPDFSDTDIVEAARINSYLLGIEFQKARNVDDVTNMDLNTFYKKFQDPVETNCIYTPVNLW